MKKWSSVLRAVEGRKSPSPIDLAHGFNSLYYRTRHDQYFITNLRHILDEITR